VIVIAITRGWLEARIIGFVMDMVVYKHCE